MASLILVNILSAAWLSIAVWQLSKGRGTAHLALGVLPVALLFLAVASVVAVVELIGAFQQIAEQGSGGVAAVAPFCLGIPRSLRLGAIGMLATVCIAAALQTYAARRFSREAPGHAPDARSTVAAGVLAAAALLMLPVVFEIQLVRGIPGLVSQGAAQTLASSEMSALSTAISSQSVLAVLCGLSLAAVLVVFGVANLIATGRGRSPDWLSKCSWMALAALVVLACWLIATTADIHALEPSSLTNGIAH